MPYNARTQESASNLYAHSIWHSIIAFVYSHRDTKYFTNEFCVKLYRKKQIY